ncbi:MAG: ZIP family metal transporter [Candidatus Anaerobiospirillum merdipullorum]|uniref:ZIP family metal transporter n=1 Tax=Candidatus Anaerobiospirillum merdipullorum TaxID=2838450 RepID=A0A9E2NSB2_9GAMM|nr:ZIP family metal transporter [Candidatus Anaerobiospirillum merdipullorum]
MSDPLYYALCATLFTCAMTAVGAAAVFLFRQQPKPLFTKLSLGFAAGIMVAASVWSLLIPAMESARAQDMLPLIPAAGGFILGVLFLVCLDSLLPHLHFGATAPEGPRIPLGRNTLLFLAITIHNIPEGMAVGVACAVAAAGGGVDGTAGALALAVGMGLQNIPEGAAVSLPLCAGGQSRQVAFLKGAFSGVVEPIAAAITVIFAAEFTPLLPWLLSFAAGAMLYVVVEELIPEAHLGEHSNGGTLCVLAGFLLMMILDTTLG